MLSIKNDNLTMTTWFSMVMGVLFFNSTKELSGDSLIFTFGNVGFEVECAELVHALFRLWCLWGLQLRFGFLGNNRIHH